MSDATLISVGELPIRDIDVSDRLRPISEAAVVSLMASIEEVGQQSEIHVRRIRHQDGRLKLILGRHRLEALSRLGCTSISAKLWECTDDWAKMAEIDDNLAHSDLAPLDLAVFLAERKALYERMYPQTKKGAFKGNQHTPDVVSDILSFTTSVAEQRDMSKRQIERLVAAGEGLDDNAIQQLRAAPQRVTLTDLQVIAKSADPVERSKICAALATGEAKTAKEAQSALSGRKKAKDIDPAEKQLKALTDAFSRASKPVQRQFVEANSEALSALLGEASGMHIAATPFRSRKGAA